MINVEGEVTRYIRIPEELYLQVHEHLVRDAHLFRAGMALDDLIIPYLEAYAASPHTERQKLIEQALAKVREGRHGSGKLEAEEVDHASEVEGPGATVRSGRGR